MIRKITLVILILLLGIGVVQATTYGPNFLPTMTSNTTPSGNVTSSSSLISPSLYPAWQAFDGVFSNLDCWLGYSNPYPLNLTIQTNIGHIVKNYTVWGTPELGSDDGPRAFQLKGSNDGSTWTLIDIRTGLSWDNTNNRDNKSFEISNTNSYTYYRFEITTNSGSTYTGIEEIQMYEAINTAPVASFTSTNLSIAINATGQSWAGHSPFIMQFNDTSTNTPTYWNSSIQGYGTNTTHLVNWSQARNATAEFTVGNFTVSWGAGNNIGYNQTTSLLWVNVTGVPPTSAFTANVTSGVNPLPVAFNDTSTNSPTMYNASFGDGLWLNQTSFPASNITHLYSTAGSYTVTWYVSNAYGTGSSTATITVYGAANSLFSALSTAGNAPFTTIFSDLSTNTTPGTDTYFWVFGDGNTSSAQNPVYTYNISGTYEVDHKFNNGLSISWNNKTAYIVVGTAAIAPVASFYGGPQLGVPPLTVYLTDVSTNTPTMWNYSWGDGTWGNGTANPSHTYTISGWFTANETVSNSAGSNTTSKSNFIGVY